MKKAALALISFAFLFGMATMSAAVSHAPPECDVGIYAKVDNITEFYQETIIIRHQVTAGLHCEQSLIFTATASMEAAAYQSGASEFAVTENATLIKKTANCGTSSTSERCCTSQSNYIVWNGAVITEDLHIKHCAIRQCSTTLGVGRS